MRNIVSSELVMIKRKAEVGRITQLRREPEAGTRIVANKHQSYQLPIYLWQELVDESSRRKRLGLSHPSQNAIAIAAITQWLEANKGGE
jgi:hypothetical protein